MEVYNLDKRQLSDTECIQLLLGHNPIKFWIYCHCKLLWRIIFWNWFNIWTGESGFWLFLKHGFREWGKPYILKS